ncbi:dolichol-P-glucose synthetase-like protein [Nocardioides gansuensis]|uniref:Dolichol-P-glucose synthetase-like protein n=1 Tax=Nocardioides gansuensis TaxID=2138300 RepID=A0A2T8FCH1_9ACTN|nr:lysylphosphatidylglycerol synthase domain-containing protein [Nocardioides gansuensis]PVG83411.1 dolichol-P-glucose synthetase-like protein [Nocardioides gansuensis]
MRATWSWTRVLTGAVVLALVAWWTGTGPFLHGLRSLDLTTLALGALIAVPTTVACAWRWHLVAAGLGVGVHLRRAVADCYRAQLLNVTLPGGVLGDVHRGVRHGLASDALGRGLRSVLWERVAGQVVQAVLVVVVLALLPSPFRGALPALLALLVVAAVTAGLLLRHGRPSSGTRIGRALHLLRGDLRDGLAARHTWPGVVVASVLAVGGHVATFLVAARAVGVAMPLTTLLPLVLVVLVAAGLPLNLAGWGPREGMAAWTFAAAGLGAGQGVAAAVAYGAIVLVASLPGALVLLASGRARPAVLEGSDDAWPSARTPS